MKKVIYTLLLAGIAGNISAQVVSSTSFYVSEGAVVSMGQDFQNNGEFTNKGKVHFQKDVMNQGKFNSEGAVVLDGYKKQTLGGAEELTFNKVVLENDVDLNTTLVVGQEIEYNRGILNSTQANPLVFASNANHFGASDFSHSVGVVKKIDANNFEFPLGDGLNYKGFTADGSNGLLTAEFRGLPTGKISQSYAPGVDYINDTEYWVVKGDNQNQFTSVRLNDSYGMDGVAYLKKGTWSISDDSRFDTKSGLNNGVIFTSGKGRFIKKDIGVWPNPTQGEFNLKLTGMNDNDAIVVDITNQDGRNVLRTQGKVSDLRKVYTLPNSLVTTELTVRVVNGDEVMTEKLILNR